MVDDIETSQSSQESESDHDIGTKAPRTVHKCKTERSVYSWPNIEQQLLVQVLISNLNQNTFISFLFLQLLSVYHHLLFPQIPCILSSFRFFDF